LDGLHVTVGVAVMRLFTFSNKTLIALNCGTTVVMIYHLAFEGSQYIFC